MRKNNNRDEHDIIITNNNKNGHNTTVINNNSNTIIIGNDNNTTITSNNDEDKDNKDYITLYIRPTIKILKNSYNKFNCYINIIYYVGLDFYLLQERVGIY